MAATEAVMRFQPILPVSGYAGWRFLSRTAESQRDLVARTPDTRRDTAEALVADRALLRVALGAFGLEADIDNRAFIRKVLESPSADPKSLANRLADKRYLEFARAFGFAEPGGPFTRRAGFAAAVISAYQTRQFEIAVGERDESMRLALTAERELAALASRQATPDALWFSVMGNPPLRQVFETALGLPRAFGALDIDRQLAVFREKTDRALGDGEIAQFADRGRREDLIRLFLLRSEMRAAPFATSASGALGLVRSIPRTRGPRG